MKQLTPRVILDIVLIVATMVLVWQNWNAVDISIFFFGFQMPLVLLFVLFFFIGYYTARIFTKR